MRKNNQLEKSILIGGCGSSGTTLLATMINQHEEIYCGPEFSLLNKRYLYNRPFETTRTKFDEFFNSGLPTQASISIPWLPSSTSTILRSDPRFCQIPEKYGVNMVYLVKLAQDCQTFPEFVNKVFLKILLSEEKTRWAEKTPTNCYCIGEFLELFQSGYYIHVIRDGRDVVPSLEKRGFSKEASVRRWMYDTATGIKFRNHPRYYEIKYEDLVKDPLKTINQLFDFLNESPITFSKLVTQNNVDKNEHDIHDSWSLSPLQPISKNATNKWKSFPKNYKEYFEMAFRFTRFSEQSTKSLGLPGKLNGNDILEILEYDSSNDWNTNPSMNFKFFRYHYLREKRGSGRPKELDYFNVNYW